VTWRLQFRTDNLWRPSRRWNGEIGYQTNLLPAFRLPRNNDANGHLTWREPRPGTVWNACRLKFATLNVGSVLRYAARLLEETMQSIDLIRDNLTKSQDRVLARVEDMREHCTVFPTPKGGSHTLWVLGHLAYIEALVVRGFMLGEPNPLAEWEDVFDGADVSGDISRYPPFDQVLATCREVRESTVALLDSLSEDSLDQSSANAPAGFEDMFGTYRLCLQYAADHWYMHRGQLADARRAAGLTRMWF